MDNQKGNPAIKGAKLHASFTGVLLGFSVTLVTLLLTLPGEEVKASQFFDYSISAFVTSAFCYLQTSAWFIHYATTPKDGAYDIASYFYYLGYLAMVLGIVYLLKLFNAYPALYIAYVFIIWVACVLFHDVYLNFKEEPSLMDYLFFSILTVAYLSIIWYTLISQ